jgi:hypothetical protein
MMFLLFSGMILFAWIMHKREKKKQGMPVERSKYSEQETIQWAGEQIQKTEHAIKKPEYEKWFEDFKPVMEKSISEQRNAIKRADKYHLFNWYEALISECNQYNNIHTKFAKYYEDIKQLESLFVKFSEYLPNFPMVNSDDDDEVNVYLLKLRSSIDNKLYLLVGISNEDSVEDIFQEDPIVDCEEVINFEGLNEDLAKSLVSKLIDKYGHKEPLDEHSRFEGYEQIIAMKSWNQASKTINEFSKNQDQLMKIGPYAIQNDYRNLLKEYKDLGFNDHFEGRKKIFIKNDKRLSGYSDKHYQRSEKTFSRFDFLRIIYEKFYVPEFNFLFNNRVNFENDLDEITYRYENWLAQNIKNMEDHVSHLCSYDYYFNMPQSRDNLYRISLPKELKETMSNNPIFVQEGSLIFFDNSFPLAVDYSSDNTKPNPFDYPWWNS